ncbi:MAG TPA: hypothetical protein VNL18_15435 [Gemmatimonadales bacterium]|nr:hypothetical protein [Gemmatimonadales bacterium]
MANALYDKARESFLGQNPALDWDTDTIKVFLLDAASYTPNLASGGTQTITGAGAIASGEAFGAARLQLTVFPAGMASGEVFGLATMRLAVRVSGIASAEGFGTPTVGISGGTQTVTGVGDIATAEAFGRPKVSGGWPRGVTIIRSRPRWGDT